MKLLKTLQALHRVQWAFIMLIASVAALFAYGLGKRDGEAAFVTPYAEQSSIPLLILLAIFVAAAWFILEYYLEPSTHVHPDVHNLVHELATITSHHRVERIRGRGALLTQPLTDHEAALILDTLGGHQRIQAIRILQPLLPAGQPYSETLQGLTSTQRSEALSIIESGATTFATYRFH